MQYPRGNTDDWEGAPSSECSRDRIHEPTEVPLPEGDLIKARRCRCSASSAVKIRRCSGNAKQWEQVGRGPEDTDFFLPDPGRQRSEALSKNAMARTLPLAPPLFRQFQYAVCFTQVLARILAPQHHELLRRFIGAAGTHGIHTLTLPYDANRQRQYGTAVAVNPRLLREFQRVGQVLRRRFDHGECRRSGTFPSSADTSEAPQRRICASAGFMPV